MNRLHSWIPLLAHLKSYHRKSFLTDLNAGVLVGVLLIPQGMAYAFLAGVPPIYGLYTALIPLLIYALFGTSHQLSIGPVAISSILIVHGVSEIAEPQTEIYITLVVVVGLLVGILQFLLGLFRAGFFVNFISHPVIAGFTSAAGIIIIMNQLKDILGIDIPRFHFTHETIYYTGQHYDQFHHPTLGLFIAGIVLMSVLKKIHRKIPYALIAVIVSILAVYLWHLDAYGVRITGEIQQGLPSFEVPDLTLVELRTLFTVVLTVSIIGIVESVSIAKYMEDADHPIKNNQELMALGLAKIFGSFFQAIPSSGSFSRSAVNHDAEATSQFSSLVTAALILMTLLFMTPVFYYLPKAILAAIITMSVYKLINIKEFIHLWHSHKGDFATMLFTFTITVIIGIEEGILIGILLSLSLVLYKSSKPTISVLGKVPGTTYFRNLDIHEQAIESEGQLIIRLENQLYFANANYFKETIKSLVYENHGRIQEILLDAKSIHEIDSSGIKVLSELIEFLNDRGITLKICGAMFALRRRLKSSGLDIEIGQDNMYAFLNDAMHEGDA